MPDCPHYAAGCCGLAAKWGQLQRVPTREDTCAACCKSTAPQEVNPAVVGLAVLAARTEAPQRVPELLAKATAVIMRGYDPIALAMKFGEAFAVWAAAGCPMRTAKEIAKLYEICSNNSCGYFEDESCGLCGCAATLRRSVFNKLAMATESCPAGFWSAATLTEIDRASDSETDHPVP